MCQCFNNFLQASWPLALVLLHRTKSYPPKLVSDLYCVCLFHGNVCLGGHLGRNIAEKSKIHGISRECRHTVAFTASSTASKMTKKPWWNSGHNATPYHRILLWLHFIQPLISVAFSEQCMWVCGSASGSVCIWCAGVNWPIRSSISDCVERRM